jgi:beta-lactamase superfamily II metal-dependent hydrolase
MPKLTFFPLGNADCCLIDLANGRKLLFDYANTRSADDESDKRVDLPSELRTDLDAADRENYDVVAFTHLDNDHICGASEFFHLRHASKYQGSGRIKIDVMWVPAGVITEEKCEDEAAVIQAEARYRLKKGEGIRVFSFTKDLQEWLRKQGINPNQRRSLVTQAGEVIHGFTTADDGVEFFAHSPFASRQDDQGELFDRNVDSLVVHATFSVDGIDTKVMLASDVDHDALSEIVRITKYHKREDRLEWDVFKLPHHCSYLSLAPDKGKDKTKPVPNVAWLFENQGQEKGIIVSTSKPIPANDDDDQPPHRQAANYHRDTTQDRNGQFIVTMEHPKVSEPKPVVIVIDRFKAAPEKRASSIGAAIVSRPAPRAGVPVAKR